MDEQQEQDDRMAAEAHQQELERRHEEEEWARWHREVTELLDNDPGYHAWLDDMNRERTEAEEYGGDGQDAVLSNEELRVWNLQQRINAMGGF